MQEEEDANIAKEAGAEIDAEMKNEEEAKPQGTPITSYVKGDLVK